MARGRNGKSKASGQAEAVTKGARIVEIVASGRTVREAADEVGVSAHWAGQLYQRELTRVMEANNDIRRELIAQDLETLRLLVRAHMPAAVGEALTIDSDGYVIDDDTTHVDSRSVLVMPPSYQSAKIVLSALDRRAKLLGLDAAIRVEVSQANVNEAVDDITNMIDNEDEGLAAVLELDARRDAR